MAASAVVAALFGAVKGRGDPKQVPKARLEVMDAHIQAVQAPR